MCNLNYPYKVKSLPYDMVSLEPVIDKTTLVIHHDKIYLSYVEKFNLIIKENKDLSNYSIEELIYNPYLIPPTILNKTLYYAGGIYNHELFFDNLTSSKHNMINGLFNKMIIDEYKSFDNYKNIILSLAASPINYHWIITTIDYKNKIEMFPSNIVAGLFKFSKKERLFCFNYSRPWKFRTNDRLQHRRTTYSTYNKSCTISINRIRRC